MIYLSVESGEGFEAFFCVAFSRNAFFGLGQYACRLLCCELSNASGKGTR